MTATLSKSNALPHSLDSERSVLGAILLNNRTLYLALENHLRPEDFYLDCHQKIYECLLVLSQKNKPLDLITVSEELKNRNWFEVAGGTGTLTDLFENNFLVGNLQAYLEILKTKSKLRQIIQIGSEIVSEALGPIPDPDDFLDEVETKVFAISDQKKTGSSSSLRDVFIKNLKNIEEMALKKSAVTGLGTGFRDLDRLTGGLNPGQLVILAARPGMGKTSFFLNICKNVVSQDPKAVVAVFSLEMQKESLGERLLSASARIPSQRLRTGNLMNSEWAALMSATEAPHG